MRVVVADKRFREVGLKSKYYTLDCNIDYPNLPDNLPLTDKVLKHYKATKNNIGFTTFRGLDEEDIKSILSATKRQEAHVNVNRYGICAFYTLHKGSY